MKWDEYIVASARTDTDRGDEAWDYYRMGLMGEIGELSEHIKKHLWHGHHLDEDAVKLELGDVAWHLAAICRMDGYDYNQDARRIDYTTGTFRGDLKRRTFRLMDTASWLCHGDGGRGGSARHVLGAMWDLCNKLHLYHEDVLQANIDKLKLRYPEGWSEEASQRREA